MGMHHLISVWDDALQLNKERRLELESAIGKAVFTLCAEPQFGHLRGPELERVTSADILNAGAAIRHAAEVHHTELAVMVWSRGSLVRLDALSAEDFNEARAQVTKEAERRASNS